MTKNDIKQARKHVTEAIVLLWPRDQSDLRDEIHDARTSLFSAAAALDTWEARHGRKAKK
jgi:hypothetical protein